MSISTLFAAIGEGLAGSIEAGVSIGVASHSLDGFPSLSRAYGCRVDARTDELRVFVAGTESSDLLRDVSATGVISAVFTEVSSQASVRLKGGSARVEALVDADRARILAYLAEYSGVLHRSGHTRAFTEQLLPRGAEGMFAIAFRPEGAAMHPAGPAQGRRTEFTP